MRYWLFLHSVLLLSLLALAAVAAIPEEQLLSSTEQTRVLNEFSSRLKAVKSFQAEFVQDRHLRAFLDVLHSKGIIQFEAPDKLRWEVRDPYLSVSILNGKKAAKFDIENGKVTRMSGMEDYLYDVLQQIAVIIRGNFEGLGKTFHIKIGRKDKQCILHLQPIDQSLSKTISGIEIVSDDQLDRVQQVKIFEPQGDRIEISFSQLSEGVIFGPGVFDLRKPVFQE